MVLQVHDPLYGILVSPEGRFLVTMGDGWDGGTATEHCLVVHDLVRGESSSFAARDFLSDEILASLLTDKLYPGPQWMSGWGAFIPSEQVFLPNLPEECRDEGLPFVVLDLRNRTVTSLPIPDKDLPADALTWRTAIQYCRVEWKCGFHPHASEPDWSLSAQLPDMVTASVPSGVTEEKKDYLPFDHQGVYVREAKTGDFVIREQDSD